MRILPLMVGSFCLSCSSPDDDTLLSGRATAGEFQMVALDSTRLREGEDHPLVAPTDLEVSADRYYVLDPLSKDVKVFSRDGSFQAVWGRPGQGPGEFSLPTDLALSSEGLLVLDRAQVRVTRFTEAGKYAGSTPLPPGRYTGLAVLDDGSLVLAGRLNESMPSRRKQEMTLHRLSPTGEYLGGFAPRESAWRPFERDVEFFFVSYRDGSLCSYSQSSPVGFRYDVETDRLREDTLNAGSYRPIDWPSEISPGGSFGQLREWWDQQTRITGLASAPGGQCLVELIDPAAGSHLLLITRTEAQPTKRLPLSPEPDPAILEAMLGDTVFSLRVDAVANLSVLRYLIHERTP